MDSSAPEKPESNLRDRFAKIFSKSPRWGLLVSGALVVLGIVLALGSITNRIYLQNPNLPKEKLQPVVTGQILPKSAPVRLRIPAIKVDASFVELGLDANNEIEIPKSYTEVGWYVHGPTPGELGPAIVLGHVDSRLLGPAVFFYLGQLKPGDTIEVEREDGTTAIFRVDKLERYSQSDFPTELVYGNIDHAGLRLITCTGTYDRQAKRYDRNLVVYASLVDSRPAPSEGGK